MLTLFTISFLLVAGAALAQQLSAWIANRPEGTGYATDDAIAEMEAAFVPREVLTFTIHVRSIPVMLHRLTEAVGRGFGGSQAETLAHRMTNQRMLDYFQATYPVEVGGVSSDLEFQWFREEDDTLRLAICAVEEVLHFASDAIEDLIIEHPA